MNKYPLASSTWDQRELDAIQSVIDKDNYTMGEKVAEFEKDFAAYTGSKYAVMVNSGSSANLAAVAALFYRKENALKRGDEIIVPAVSWSTTYAPLYQYGLKLKFVDVDLLTLNYDLDQLKNAVTDDTKAIMAVNLLGNPNDFSKIQEIISGRDILLLEDNCESLGATFQGVQCGTFGIMGTYSSFFSHHIATMEGGVVVTDDEELYHILLCLRAHGWTRQLPKQNTLVEKSDDPFEESFRFILPGYNLRPLEMSGAIGVEQMKKLPGFIAQRRKNAELFQTLFKDDSRFYIQKETGMSSWFGFSFIIREDAGIQRKQVIELLSERHIDTRPIVTGDFTKNEVLKYFDYEIFGEMKNAALLDTNGFFVGNHQIDLTEEIQYLHSVLSELK